MGALIKVWLILVILYLFINSGVGIWFALNGTPEAAIVSIIGLLGGFLFIRKWREL